MTAQRNHPMAHDNTDLTQLPQLRAKIADFSAKLKKVFTTFLSFSFPPPASETASADPTVAARWPDGRLAQ